MREPSMEREIATVLAQTSLSWLVLIAIEFIGLSLHPSSYEGGLQSIAILIGPVIVNGIVLVAGLPFRILPRLSRFTRRHGELALAVASAGFLLIVLDPLPAGFGALIGFFVVAAGLVHAWPPFGWLWDDEAQTRRKIERGRALSQV